MISIHLVTPLDGVMTMEDLNYALDIANAGFILEPDCSRRWVSGAVVMARFLEQHGLIRAASDFYRRQRELAMYRCKPHRCALLKTPRCPGRIINGELEFLATDGLNIGRFLFKKGSVTAHAWQDKFTHDINAVNAMLIGFCGKLTSNVNAFVEDTQEYFKWIDQLINVQTGNRW